MIAIQSLPEAPPRPKATGPGALLTIKPVCAIQPDAPTRLKRLTVQPLEAATVPGALLTIKTVCALKGISPATVFRKIRSGELEAVRMGARCTRITAESAAKLGRSE